jgi:protein ImuA
MNIGKAVMAAAKSTLSHLRQTLAGLDPSLKPALPGGVREVGLDLGIDALGIDAALGGGLACNGLHELAPAGPIHLAAASGFAMALAALSGRQRGETLWIATDFAACEAGGPYGPGLDLFGVTTARFIMLRVPRAVDALWAMEEALRCGALANVVAELTGEGADADLTATRRLALAAREGKGGCLGLLLRHISPSMPSAAATRWQVAAASSAPDRYGGLGPPCFDLVLVKNRRGPCGRWTVTWDHHEHVFQSAIPFGVAAAPLHRPDRAPLGLVG